VPCLQEAEVLSANVLSGAGGQSRGCAVVEFGSVQDAARAAAALNDTDFRGRPLHVREDREEKKVFASA
jgi:RNA recognition motif-containing protein